MKKELKLAALGAVVLLGLGAVTQARAAETRSTTLAPWAEAAAAPQGVIVSFSAINVAPIKGPDGTGIDTAPPDVSPIEP